MKPRAKRPNEEITTQILVQIEKGTREITSCIESKAAEDIANNKKALKLELLQQVHLHLLRLVDTQEIALTPTQQSFIRFCCHLYTHKKLMDDVSINKLRELANTAKEKDAKAEDQNKEIILTYLMSYFDADLKLKQADQSSRPRILLTKNAHAYMLYLRLKETKELKVNYPATHLEALRKKIEKRQLAEILKQEAKEKAKIEECQLAEKSKQEAEAKEKAETALKKMQRQFEDQQHLANLFMTAISSNLPLWQKKCSKFGSYSKINNIQVPGSIAVAFRLLKKNTETFNHATLVEAFVKLRAMAKARLTLTQRCRYKLFSLRHDDVTTFLSLLSNAKVENIDSIESSLTKMGLTVSKTIKNRDEINACPVKILTNGCIIRI